MTPFDVSWMAPSTSPLRSALLDRAWRQWIALGADAVGEADASVVDPEALIALTAELGDADARLRDVSTDWCVAYGRYVNGARLKQVAKEIATPLTGIGEYVATVAAAGGPAWPMATEPRQDYVPRGKARLSSATVPARLRVRLRAAFGVNARADVLAALLDAPDIGVSLADLAHRTRFTKPNIASAVDALVLAGLVSTRQRGNQRRITLATLAASGELLPGLRWPVPQPDWVAWYGVCLAALRFESRPAMTTTVRAIEARRSIEPLLGRILDAAIPVPDLGPLGSEFASAYDVWVEELVETLSGLNPI